MDVINVIWKLNIFFRWKLGHIKTLLKIIEIFFEVHLSFWDIKSLILLTIMNCRPNWHPYVKFFEKNNFLIVKTWYSKPTALTNFWKSSNHTPMPKMILQLLIANFKRIEFAYREPKVYFSCKIEDISWDVYYYSSYF